MFEHEHESILYEARPAHAWYWPSYCCLTMAQPRPHTIQHNDPGLSASSSSTIARLGPPAGLLLSDCPQTMDQFQHRTLNNTFLHITEVEPIGWGLAFNKVKSNYTIKKCSDDF